jgi:hypothetical protein
VQKCLHQLADIGRRHQLELIRMLEQDQTVRR